MAIAVIGYGVVGQHMAADITKGGNIAVICDPFKGHNPSREEINKCDAAFVCVGTPSNRDGSCDTSYVEEVLSWLQTPVVIIRSTIPPGTVDRLASVPTVFVPEFIGEGVNAPYNAMKQPPFLIIGGKPEAQRAASQVLSTMYNSECEFIYVDARTAETAKYAENYFLALKVTWANEMFDICKSTGADFNQMMSAVTHDYRIGRGHTHVYENKRGWGGRCLPKDTSALYYAVGPEVAPLLRAMIQINETHRASNRS